MSDTNTDVRGHDHPVCASVVDVLARIGDKWTVMVVGTLSEGPLRYNELQRQVGRISQRMLTLTLKALEQDGLVSRTMYPSIPPRVDYELTDLGRSLMEPLHTLYEWAKEHGDEMAAARQIYEAKSAERAAVHAARFSPK
ncbi:MULTISPECIES: helix-turn-helix domain-containing protein [Paraburkholderia]|uniref:winged helix-turn-helix transcriptional regulator n=1 Tax=Paraburkholderia TaxID=1822464 RepID=UPI002AB19639|nr:MULTISPECIES: helix-turn-helix domain-containing protein [Paraburkholderia]